MRRRSEQGLGTTKRKQKHPGVTLEKPDTKRGIGWRARLVEVDSCEIVDGKLKLSTGKTRKESLPSDLTTTEQRVAWAQGKARELAKRIEELEGGAPKSTGMTPWKPRSSATTRTTRSSATRP
jgi:hypothetical protein